jgi:hypothetical protein
LVIERFDGIGQGMFEFRVPWLPRCWQGAREDAVGVVLQAKHLVAANARTLSIGGIIVERLLPFLEARDACSILTTGIGGSSQLNRLHVLSLSVPLQWRTSPTCAWQVTVKEGYMASTTTPQSRESHKKLKPKPKTEA